MARKFSKLSDPGTLAGSVGRYTQLKARLTNEQAQLVERQDALRAQLVQRLAATDAKVGASRSTMSLLQNQIDAWNAQRD